MSAQNRAAWDRISDEYQRDHGPQLSKTELLWGGWSIPESELRILGDVAGKDALELGCGAAQMSIVLARAGARPVGLDVSSRQLEHARRLMDEAGVEFPLVQAPAENVPLPDESFDVVFCDHGGMTWADPYRSVPEAARVLRSGGLLAFNMTSPIAEICMDEATGVAGDRLQLDYFSLHRIEGGWGAVGYQLPYGEWIRLLRRSGLVVEDLVDLKPPEGATTTFTGWVPYEWARRWPSENVWKARKV
jgi:SAM-dependent methyltransferase